MELQHSTINNACKIHMHMNIVRYNTGLAHSRNTIFWKTELMNESMAHLPLKSGFFHFCTIVFESTHFILEKTLFQLPFFKKIMFF